MSGYALSSELFELSEQNDRRFRRLLSGFALPALILGIVIPFLHITQVLDPIIEPLKRIAKLLPELPEPKKPEPEPEKPKPPKPQLTPEQKIAKAREKVSRLMDPFDDLSDLRDKSLPETPAQLNAELITSNTRSSRVIDATRTSGGIGDTSVVDRNATTSIGSRSTTSVKSTISTGGGTRSGSGGGRIPDRTDEEIQIVFDRAKGAFYALYTRAQRSYPNMAGKMVIRLTILPSGKVKSAKLVSSELNNPEFEQKVIARVLLMDFGAKNVGDFTKDYPMVFFPS